MADRELDIMLKGNPAPTVGADAPCKTAAAFRPASTRLSWD